MEGKNVLPHVKQAVAAYDSGKQVTETYVSIGSTVNKCKLDLAKRLTTPITTRCSSN